MARGSSSEPRSNVSATSTAANDAALTAKTLPAPAHAYSTAASAGPNSLPIACAELDRPTAPAIASRGVSLGSVPGPGAELLEERETTVEGRVYRGLRRLRETLV